MRQKDEWRYWKEIEDAVLRKDCERTAHWVVELLIHRCHPSRQLPVINYGQGRKPLDSDNRTTEFDQ